MLGHSVYSTNSILLNLSLTLAALNFRAARHYFCRTINTKHQYYQWEFMENTHNEDVFSV
jgi:hypothetical protein